jgi:hypothetical protein
MPVSPQFIRAGFSLFEDSGFALNPDSLLEGIIGRDAVNLPLLRHLHLE